MSDRSTRYEAGSEPTRSTYTTDLVADDEQECGYVYDHTIKTTYEGPDGWQGVCDECGAEFWEDPDEEPIREGGAE